MFISNLFFSSTQKFKAIGIPFFLAFAVLPTISVFAQSDLRDSVYGKPKKTSKTIIPKATPQPLNRNKLAPTTTAKTTRTAPKPVVKKTVTKALVPVTFNGKEPLVEVWLNDKKIGLTNDRLQFTKKIAPGEYRLMARTKWQVVLSAKMITINAGQNSFDLYEKKPPVLQVVQPKTDTEQPKEKSELEIAKEITEKVKSIIETYENPATTDTVTTEDWQIVFQAAQLGQIQDFTAVQIEAQRWFASGQIELTKKQYTNAFTAFKKATEYLPMWAFPYYEIGNAYVASKQDQLPDAIKMYQRALQINNKLGMIYKKLGDAQRLSNKDKEALAAYELAAQFGYRTFETRYLIASLRIENKQIEKGIEEFESLTKETPKAELYVKLGEAYEKVKRPVIAKENYEKAISLDPNATQAHYRVGVINLNLREYDRAKVSLEKAISLDPAGRVLDIKDAQKKLREIATKSNNR